MAETLQITNGLLTLNLINGTNGIHLHTWEAGISQYKGDGVFVDAPLRESKQLIYGVQDTVDEEMEISITGATQSEVASNVNNLFNFELAANNYWQYRSSAATPYYLVTKQNDETSSRYAIIYFIKVENLTNLFGRDFSSGMSEGVGIMGVSITITRGQWSKYPPNQYQSTITDTRQTYSVTVDGTSVLTITGGWGGEWVGQNVLEYMDNLGRLVLLRDPTANSGSASTSYRYSDNGGSSWSSGTFPIEIRRVINSYYFDGYLYALCTVTTTGDTLYRSANGTSWSSVTIPEAFSGIYEGDIYLFFISANGVYRTSNGTTFTLITSTAYQTVVYFDGVYYFSSAGFTDYTTDFSTYTRFHTFPSTGYAAYPFIFNNQLYATAGLSLYKQGSLMNALFTLLI